MSNSTNFVHRHRKAIAQVITAVYLANPLLVTAQVILNANTPNDGRRAFVDQTQNGITKVNIASPNGAGVSHNTYQQFDVPKAGVILNNGATNSNTRLAGWVEGNPNLLPGQEAKLILNEVVGGKPSQLQGYVEVAGKKADVIIANEYGVTCNGCGFINTERTTLTTGKPVFNGDGSLGQLRVEQGQFQIGSEGLQATGSRLDIVSRYANVQGAVHADQINVVTGSNTVDYVNGQTTRLQTPADVTPRGLDVGQLGGMYANQITLMATGQGVGVNLDGQLLGAGHVSIQSDGTLQHKGKTQGDGGVRIEATELTQTGHLQSQQTIQVQAGKLNNSGTLQAAQQVQLLGEDMVQAGAIQASHIQINATGNIDNSGTLTAGAGGLSVQAGAVLDNRTTGRMQSQVQITLQATQLNNAGQITAETDVKLQAQDLQNNATIQAVGQLTAQAQRIHNSATLLANGVTLTSQTLSNSGRIEGERLTLQAQDAQSTLTNSGQIAGSNIQIQGHAQLHNTGKISTAVDATASTDNLQNLNIQVVQLNNNGGKLIARNQLDLQTERLDNRSGTIATIDGDLRIQSNAIDNRSGQILQQGATKIMHLRATGALHNGSGQVEGQGQTLTLEAAELSNNSGQIQHTATVQAGQAEPVMTVTVMPSAHGSGQLQNIQGTLSATGQMRIQAQALITDASDPRRSASTTLQFMDKAAAQSGSAPSDSGYDWQADIAANEKANAAKAEADQKAAQAQTAAQQLTQANTLLSQAQTQKTTTTSALTQAQANLNAAQTQATTAQSAAQAAPQDAALAQAAQTAQAQVSSAQTAVNQAQAADQQAQTALTQAQADAQVAQASKAAADSANTKAQAAYLAAQADVKTVTDGTSGSSTSASDAPKPADLQLSAATAPAATSSGSLVQAGRKLTLTLGTGGLDNRQGRLQGRDIQVQSQGDIWAGQINAQNNLNLQADHIEAEQLIQATTVRVNAQRLNNTGRTEGTQELQIEAQRLDNSGTLQSANTQLQGQMAGGPTDLVLNNTGLVQGYVNLNIDATQVLNTGTLSAGQVQIRGANQLENRGVIFSTGNMTLQGPDIVNNQGRIYSMGDLTVEGEQAGQAAGSVFNYAGRIEAQGDVNINADTLTNRAVLPSVNQRGFVEHIRDGGNIITRATDTFNADGKKTEIIAGKKLNITAKTVNNDYGILSAWHQVNITADTINNTAYGAIQTENMVVKAACYNCHQTVRYADSWGGRIESGGAAQLRALVINNKTTDTRDGFAGLSTDPRVVIVDERSGTQSPLTQAFVDRFGIVTGPSTAAGENTPAPLPGPRLLSDNLVLTAYGRFDFSRFVLPDGKTGLFQLADPASPYLIQGRTDLIPREIGAQNTVYNQFLGSDYLMTRLGLIPGGAKRLGDAWYETQLVQEQLYALSGRRYLVAGTTSDYDLMRSLMDAGLLAQAQLRLVAGDPLSAEQQAALTQDMVWPEWQDVAGQRVLVPKVYLAQKQGTPGDAERQVGALIAGQSVDIQTTELNQSHGHIAAGGPLNINAKGAVQGSGSYSGGTSVAVVAGNVDLQNASVQSAGWLKLQTTQGDLNLAATQIKAAGDATLQSAGALNLSAQKHEAHVVRGDGSKKDEVKYETTNIQVGGSATITSVGDLTVQGSAIAAGQDLKLQSTAGSIDLQSVTNTETATNVLVRQDNAAALATQANDPLSRFAGLFGRRQSEPQPEPERIDIHHQSVQGVQLQSGGTTRVLAGRDLQTTGLQLQAVQGAGLESAGAMQLQDTRVVAKDVAIQVGGPLQAQNLAVNGQGSVDIQAASAQLANSQLQSAGNLTLKTTQGDLTLTASGVKAAGNATLDSAGTLQLLATEQKSTVGNTSTTRHNPSNVQAGGIAKLTSVDDLTTQGSTITAGQDLKLQSTGGSVDLQALKSSSDTSSTSTSGMRLFARTSTTTVHTEAVQGTQLQAGGNAQVLAAQNLSAQSLQLQAGGNATLAAAGTLALTSEQAYSRTQTGSDVRQSLQTERSQIQAGGNATLYGQQAVQMGAADVRAGGNAQVTSQGAVILDANTDTEQRNWTTSSSSSTWYGKTKTTTTQHQTLDQEAERTRISAGQQAVVLGGNVLSVGAQVQGKTLTQIEGADQTLLYDVQEVHQYSANSQTSKGFLGITYSKSTSQDSRLQSNALPTELKSDQAVRVGVGAVTDVRGAVLTAPQIEFYRSANADTTQPGELILGASTNTSQTSHTEKTVTAGVWQKQEGQGQTSQTANQTQINGQLVIGQGINTQVQVPEGALKDQIMQLASQPGQGYIAELASNPKINWEQIKLVHDQWQYSQQGLTGAGAALLAIAVAYFTAGMGTALVGTTTTTTAATATTAAVSTTTAAGTTLATTTAATATTAATVSYTAAGAALNAGFSALASSAAVSFVNNGGDLGQTLKDLGSKDSVKNILISMATAGALNELGNANLIGNKALNQITAADGFTANLGKNVVNNLASATMNSALTGAKLEDSLKTALTSAVISAGAGQAASTIGDMTQDSPAVKALAHALAGCVAGGAGSGSQGCQSGAIGAVVGELAAQWYDPTGTKPPAQTLEFVKVVSAAAGAVTGDGSAQSVNTAVMTGVNAAENNYLAHAEAQRLAELKQKQLLGQCDTSCQKQIDWLNAVDAARNQKLNSCANSNSADCSSARSELRTAAAEYIRLNAVVPSVSTVYQNERNETLTLARQTMQDYTIWNVTKGVGGSVLDGAKALGGAAYTGFKALLGNEQAQQDVKAGLGATWDFVKEPGNWPELMGAMSPVQREQLAQAYERGDGKTVASMLGEQLTNLPGAGGAGSIKTVVKTVDKAQDVTKLAVRGDVEKVVQVPVGAKGNWDPSINTGTTESLAPKTAYMLDNGHAYITDDVGRVKAVEGTLSLDKMDRNTYQQLCAGQSGCVGDDGGHLIASSLGGAGDRINIVPQAATLNRQDWKDMENYFRSELQAGKAVNVKIDVGYPASGGVRPDGFVVNAMIGGKPWSKEFKQ